jgi:hypothetical protein
LRREPATGTKEQAQFKCVLAFFQTRMMVIVLCERKVIS